MLLTSNVVEHPHDKLVPVVTRVLASLSSFFFSFEVNKKKNLLILSRN